MLLHFSSFRSFANNLILLEVLHSDFQRFFVVWFSSRISRMDHGLHGLTVLDEAAIEWLRNTCPEIYCGQAVS